MVESLETLLRRSVRRALRPAVLILVLLASSVASASGTDPGYTLTSLSSPQWALDSGGSASGETKPAAAAEGARHRGQPLWGIVSEFRLGVLNHDIYFPNRYSFSVAPFRHRFEHGANVNVEVLFVSPSFFKYILWPRPRLGGSKNTCGYTDNVYVDLDWGHQFQLGPYLEGYLGAAMQDGNLNFGNPQRTEFGSRFLFHLGVEVGWRFFHHHGISLVWEHMSNSDLAHRNQGMDSVGAQYGYRFDL